MTEEPIPDAIVVRDILSGGQASYAILVRRYQQGLYSYVRKMVLDHEASIDLVQEAFVKAYLNIRDCRKPESFRSWLFSVGRNLCLDYLKNVRRLSVPFSLLPEVLEVSSSDAERQALKWKLDEALGQLPPDLRDAFLLKHDAGYSYDEIARMTRATPSAVKMRVYRARAALRRFLDVGVAGEGAIDDPPVVLVHEVGLVSEEEV